MLERRLESHHNAQLFAVVIEEFIIRRVETWHVWHVCLFEAPIFSAGASTRKVKLVLASELHSPRSIEIMQW